VIHYHGLPITPQSELLKLAGCNFFVSYAAPAQVGLAHDLGQSVGLDNGAFSFWRTGKDTDWVGFVRWAKPWLEYPTSWGVMPDVIDGSEEDNDRLIAWLFNHDREVWAKSAPVYHLHEPIDRLKRLCAGYSRVCIGSSGQYAIVNSDPWRRRMDQAFNAVCGNGPVPVWLHMLRGMSLSGSEYPFASVDSTDVARNHNRPQNDVVRMARRWDGMQNPARWTMREQLELAA
jgi:hypothetical protein